MSPQTYEDKVTYYESSLELAYRDGSVEVNKSVGVANGLRRCINGCWVITSCQGCDVGELHVGNDIGGLVTTSKCPGLAPADLFVGNVSLGEVDRDPLELLRVASDVCSELKSVNVVRCEFIMYVRDCKRVIERGDGTACERKVVTEFITGVVSKGLRYGYGGIHTALVTRLSNVTEAFIDKLIRETYERSVRSSRAKALNPIYVGRHQLILRPEVTAALMHEISHLLEATSLSRLNIGSRVGPPELELIDDPHEPSSPAIRLFDDEGVPTIRRKLVEGGLVIDYHHTRTSAYVLGGRAGSAYGLFHPPIPLHTTLVMKAGDWRDDEIVQETSRGFVVDGVVMAETEGSYVRIVPEYALHIERGEVRDYVKLSSIRIPLRKLMTISAISRSSALRVSYERKYLVAEVAPTIRIEGYVE